LGPFGRQRGGPALMGTANGDSPGIFLLKLAQGISSYQPYKVSKTWDKAKQHKNELLKNG